MMAAGRTLAEIAETTAVTPATVSKWIREPAVVEHYRKRIDGYAYTRFSKAMQVLEEQLDHSNPWVRQAAAREIIARTGDSVMGVDTRELVIRIDGAPAIGLPSASTDHTADYIEVEDVDIT